MNRRDGYTNSLRSFPSKEAGSISISPSRFQPRSQPALRRRRPLLVRLALAVSVSFLLLIIFAPSLRAAVFSAFSLGLLSAPEELKLETVRYYDLSNSGGSGKGWEREERVLMCAPLRDAESHLPMFFSHLHNFTYPHHLIDLAFLVSDSKDNTLNLLSQMLTDLQNDPDPRQPYGEISVIEKDFGQKVNQDVESRHGFAAQASRRKLMAQARNWLLSAALRPTHSWVYWRDVDVETAPFTILEDLMRHDKDVIVPNVWRPLPDWLGGEQPYDLNSWQESETALALADTLDEDAVIVEGYAEYATWRPHLAYLRDPYGDPDMEMEIDGVGGVSILAKAKVFRSGVHFPAFSFEKHAETEGFGKMAKRMQYSVVGLPHYTVWHLYEPSVDDIRHMEEMEQERRDRENEERERNERAKKIKEEFGDPGSQWDKDKTDMTEITQQDEQIKKEHEAAMAAQDKDKASDSTASKDSSDGKDTKESKSTKQVKDEGEPSTETKDENVLKDSKDINESKQTKDNKDTKDSKDTKDAKDSKETKETKDAKDAKDAKDSKNSKNTKDTKESKVDSEDTDGKDSEENNGKNEGADTKGSKNTKNAKVTKESKGDGEDIESKDSKNTKDSKETKGSSGDAETQESKGSKISKNSKESKVGSEDADSKDTKDAKETRSKTEEKAKGDKEKKKKLEEDSKDP